MSKVNLFDITLQEKIDDLRQQIVDELTPLGEVSVSGEITPFEGGYLMDEVTASVKAPTLSRPIRLDIKWDSANNAPVYYQNGSVMLPPSRDYGSLDTTGTQVVETVMRRIPDAVDVSTEDIRKARKKGAVITAGILSVSAAIAIAPHVAAPMLGLWSAGAGTAIFAHIFLGMFFGLVALLPLYAIDGVGVMEDEAFNKWNSAGRKDAFYTLFHSAPERAVFISELSSFVKGYGIEFKGNPAIQDHTVPGSTSTGVELPLIQFSGSTDGKNLSNYAFDGKNLYKYKHNYSGQDVELELIWKKSAPVNAQVNTQVDSRADEVASVSHDSHEKKSILLNKIKFPSWK